MAVHDSGSVRIPENLPKDRILLWTEGIDKLTAINPGFRCILP